MDSLIITGVRGVPAAHGGFETFAERLALHFVGAGIKVTVYCQDDAIFPAVEEDTWRGVHRVRIRERRKGAFGTLIFDWKALQDAKKRKGTLLTLGYNTGFFNWLLVGSAKRQIINMDGIEWMREKWSWPARVWLRFNERFACMAADRVVADHPEIANHLARIVSSDRIKVIPYGSDRILVADKTRLDQFGLDEGRFAVIIARPEPENSVLQIVRAFSRRRRSMKLVVLGRYEPDVNGFHKSVLNAASDEVVFPGAIYDKATVEALRFYARLYIHGHTVGGTNPSLVEALGAGSAVLAHDNKFNRWVAGKGGHYFLDEEGCANELNALLCNDSEIARMKDASVARFQEALTWDSILSQYEHLLCDGVIEAGVAKHSVGL